METNPGPTNTRQGQISKTGEVVCPVNEGVAELTMLVQSLKSDIATLRAEVKDSKTEVQELNIKEEVIKIQEDVRCLKKDNEVLKAKTDSNESLAKQKNIILYGLKETPSERFEDCERLVRDILSGEFKIDGAASEREYQSQIHLDLGQC